MNVKELLTRWSTGELDITTVARSAREKLSQDGKTYTKLLGWEQDSRLQELIDKGAIVIHYDEINDLHDFAFKTMWIDDYDVVGKGRKKIPNGRKRRILTPEALKLVMKKQDRSRDANTSAIIKHYGDEIDNSVFNKS